MEILKMDEATLKKKYKGRKIFLSICGVLIVLLLTLYFIATNNTQIVIGMLQKLSYGDNPINSYESFYEPISRKKDNGQYLISEINYDSEYPNGFLDITYPNENRDVDRPTLFYFHGGGFFAGSKNMGDPMAAPEATYLVDDICAAAKGYEYMAYRQMLRGWNRVGDTDDQPAVQPWQRAAAESMAVFADDG